MKNVNIVKGFDTVVEAVVGQTHLIVDSMATTLVDAANMVSDITNKLVKKTGKFIKKQQSKCTPIDEHVDNVRKIYSDYKNNLSKIEKEYLDRIDEYYDENIVGSDESLKMHEEYFSERLDLWFKYLKDAYNDICGVEPEIRALIIVLALIDTDNTIDCYNGDYLIGCTCDVVYRDYNVMVCMNIEKKVIEIVGLNDERWGKFRDLITSRYENIRIQH